MLLLQVWYCTLMCYYYSICFTIIGLILYSMCYYCSLCITIIGLIWAEIKQLWDEGAHDYVHDMWNILDFVTNSLYIATFTLRLIAYLQVGIHHCWTGLWIFQYQFYIRPCLLMCAYTDKYHFIIYLSIWFLNLSNMFANWSEIYPLRVTINIYLKNSKTRSCN